MAVGEDVTAQAEALYRGLVATFDALVPLIPEGRVDERDGYRVVLSPRTPFSLFCGPWIEDPARDAQIAERLVEIVGEVEQAGVPCWIQVRDGQTPITQQRAWQLGFTESEVDLGMVMRPGELRAPSPIPGLEIREVAGEPEARCSLLVAEAGFGVPESTFAPLYTGEIYGHRGAAFYLGTVDGEPVTTGFGFRSEATLGVYNIATPPQHRRCGYASQIVARVVEDGFAQGATLAYLRASPMGSSVYERLGFRTVERYLELARPPQ